MFTEFEKKYICNHDFTTTIKDMSRKLGKSGKDIYECYSDLVDSGEYLSIRKHARKARREKIERERNLKKGNKSDGGEPSEGVRDNHDSDYIGSNIFDDMWANNDTTWRGRDGIRSISRDSDSRINYSQMS